MSFSLLIPSKLGLESLTAREIIDLGYKPQAKNGEVEVEGDFSAIPRLNLWLRTGERVFLKLSEFPASTFDELFDGIAQIPWEDLLPRDAQVHVFSKCLFSALMSDRTAQSIGKKAILERLKKTYKLETFPETGVEFKIHVEILHDRARILLDSSGAGLHKRGYRAEAGEAPLRETIAAAMVMLSRWTPPYPLVDPFCGSGTIPIEAALIGTDTAPGLRRTFAAEEWEFLSKKFWKKEREAARARQKKEPFTIEAFDADDAILKVAVSNAKKAGVEAHIAFAKRPIEQFRFEGRGALIANPPYGERLDDLAQAENTARAFGKAVAAYPGLRTFVLTPHPAFEKLFGRRADKNRKIYNGKIKCYLYEFKATDLR